MRSLLFAFAFTAVVASALAGAGKDSPFGGRRVLLIGVDGCRADALHKLVDGGRAPNFRALIESGTVTWNAYAGGELGKATQQETSSGPGWSTIFTGVWRDRHGVANNKFRDHRIADWPHWMRRIRDVSPQAW